ncbi:hypothetical protein EYF80_046760 [Liparis tanakae]|uniref:Uncharacterized protein n=1 Tax=Liparis tanakae TaxID=230148 RepID=A0A4Z2FQ97_9TELE|nr:hypothetical protein EYF80_046760 [Liparis tanakae]
MSPCMYLKATKACSLWTNPVFPVSTDIRLSAHCPAVGPEAARKQEQQQRNAVQFVACSRELVGISGCQWVSKTMTMAE